MIFGAILLCPNTNRSDTNAEHFSMEKTIILFNFCVYMFRCGVQIDCVLMLRANCIGEDAFTKFRGIFTVFWSHQSFFLSFLPFFSSIFHKCVVASVQIICVRVCAVWTIWIDNFCCSFAQFKWLFFFCSCLISIRLLRFFPAIFCVCTCLLAIYVHIVCLAFFARTKQRERATKNVFVATFFCVNSFAPI